MAYGALQVLQPSLHPTLRIHVLFSSLSPLSNSPALTLGPPAIPQTHQAYACLSAFTLLGTLF